MVRARYWGEDINEIITTEWRDLNKKREALEDNDTVINYLPLPALILNQGPPAPWVDPHEVSASIKALLLCHILNNLERKIEKKINKNTTKDETNTTDQVCTFDVSISLRPDGDPSHVITVNRIKEHKEENDTSETPDATSDTPSE